MVSGAFFYTTGGTYTRLVRERLSQGSVDLFAEPRGSNRLDGQPKFDVKLEKRVPDRRRPAGDHRSRASTCSTTAPWTTLSRGSGATITADRVVAPRTWRIGGVFSF